MDLKKDSGSTSQDPLGRLPGLLHDLAPKHPLSIEEMDEGIRRHIVKKHGKRGARADFNL